MSDNAPLLRGVCLYSRVFHKKQSNFFAVFAEITVDYFPFMVYYNIE